MDFILNIIVIVVILTAFILILYKLFHKKEHEIVEMEIRYDLEVLIEQVKNEINQILNTDVDELKLNERETKKRIKQKSILRDAIRNCCLGDLGKREYVKEYIKSILQDACGINEVSIDDAIPFGDSDRLEDGIKFLIIYYIKSMEHGNKAFGYFVENEWQIEKNKSDGMHYEVTADDINQSYDLNNRGLTYFEKLEILTQLIYQQSYGLDVVDVIITDDSIDNCSGGVGGISESDYNYLDEMISSGQTENNCYDSIFVMYHGRQIRQSYLSFKSKERLMRVVKNIYRYDAPEMLTAQNGFVIASRQDNTRVTVARPPASVSWTFFLRKFKSVKFDLDVLLTGLNVPTAIKLLKWIVEANETFTVSGSPASGKTTLLKALVPLIDPTMSIRMAETVFETMFNVLLPDRNVQVMQERGKVKVADIITAFKKMDTDITILGEIAEPEMAGAFVQIAQSGGKMTMCTLHHETTEKLIDYMRNALMVHYDMKDAVLAENQVVSILNFDIHMAKGRDGCRYIERITEIVPAERPVFVNGNNGEESMMNFFKYFAEMNNKRTYLTNDVLRYNLSNGSYEMVNMISGTGLERFKRKLSEERYGQFMEFLNSSVNRGGI